MTFNEIQTQVAELLNLTSTKTLDRIGREINERYRWICAEVGLQTTIPATKAASTVVGERTLTFNLIRISRVYDNTPPTQPRVLWQRTFDELRNWVVVSDPPQNYAVVMTGSTTTTIFLDSNPSSVYPLTADGLGQTPALSGDMEPRFPENFHDMLINAVKDIELRKMQKTGEADKELVMFMKRLGQLQYFVAKNAYVQINQGRYSGPQFPMPYLV